MDDPIYPAPELVVTDGDRLQVLGAPPGPAGVSTVELADGAIWQVDHVNLETYALLEVDDADAPNSTLLSTAFGGDGALFAIEGTLDLNGGDDWRAVFERRRPWRPSRWRGQPFGPNRAGEAGGLALLTDQTTDARVHPLGRIVAALETASQVDHNPARPLIEPLVPYLLENAARLVDRFDDDEIATLDPLTLSAVDDLIRRVRTAHGAPRWATALLGALADRIATIAPGGGSAAESGLMAAMAFTESPERSVFDRMASASMPGVPDTDQPILERTADALVEVTVTRSEEPRWARVLRHGSLILLGQAPLRRKGLVDVAEVVVPADVADADLHAQVVAETDLDQVAHGPLDAMRAAISAGREAARADRLARPELARARWERCAELWAEAGDGDRASQARDLARSADTNPAQSPTTTDHVVEMLAPLV